MSYNGSGTYIPPAGQPVATGTVIQSSSFNTLVTDIANTFNNVLPRDGQASMAGQLKLIDGTSSVPAISFNSEASTGLFRPSTGLMAVSVSGVENLRFNSSGRVLIGTTADDGTNRLQVNGATKITGALAVTGACTVTGALSAASYSGPLTGNVTGNVNGTAANVTGVVALANGGTGATTGAGALTNLGAAPIASPAFSGTVTGNFSGPLTGSVTGNVSGTSANVTGVIAVANGGTGSTTAGGALINLGAAPSASPTFTGTVSGVTATMVGLGNVMNTSDANKPVSTATASALALKANLSGANFTGNVGIGTEAYTQASAFQLGRVLSFSHDINSGYMGAGWHGTNSGAATYAVTGNYATRMHFDSALGGMYWLNAVAGTAGNAVSFSERMRLTNTGNLLLGTTSDNAVDKLQMAGSARINSGSGIGLTVSGVTSTKLQIASSDTTSTAFPKLEFYHNGNDTFTIEAGQLGCKFMQSGAMERMRISGAGNLLVGTASDNGTDKLQVSGSLGVVGPATSASSFSWQQGGGRLPGYLYSDGGGAGVFDTPATTRNGIYMAASNYVSVYTSTSEKVRFGSNGNVLIGTTTDNGSKLQVNGASFVGGTLSVNSAFGGSPGLVITNTTTSNYAIAKMQGDGTGGGQVSFYANGSSTGGVYGDSTGLTLYTGLSSIAMRVTAAGVIQDAAGNELGYKDAVQNIQGAPYTLVVGDRGKSVVMNAASSAVTVPSGVFGGGAVVTIYNNTGSAQTIIQGSGTNMKYGASASPLTGNRTLANNGICTLYFINGSAVSISGNGVT